MLFCAFIMGWKGDIWLPLARFGCRPNPVMVMVAIAGELRRFYWKENARFGRTFACLAGFVLWILKHILHSP